jgi:hypothetical protein
MVSASPATRVPPAPRPEPHPRPARRVSRQRGRWWVAGLVAGALALGTVLPPLINLNRYQRQIAAGISRSLGRPVELSGVHLELLPRPGFEIANFEVDEAPGFGAEPMLMCSSVSASVRLQSLWRGRLEISRISFDGPSLNLERNARGYWNFGPILTQASRAETAPTGQRIAGRELRFPYIEATNARVNFKYGEEKKPFSFLNADVAVWLENPGEWRVRFRAAPVRTDIQMSAADTGEVLVEGAVRRAAELNALPLDLQASWTGAPLGQVTRLLTTEDYGWRGTAGVTAHIAGTPEDLLVRASGTAEGFHRAEFEPARTLRLAGTCGAEYVRRQGLLRGVDCAAPVGDGRLRLTGEVADVLGHPGPNLTLAIQAVPVAGALELLEDVHHGFTPGAGASGVVDGGFALGQNGLSGDATVRNFALQAPGLDQPVSLPEFRVAAAVTGTKGGPALTLEPVQARMGAATPLGVSGWFTREGFALHLAGTAAMARLLPLSRAYGLAPGLVEGLQPVGEAQMNLALNGPWLMRMNDGAPIPSAVNGSFTLRHAEVQTSYVRRPLHIENAQGAVTGDEITWDDISARFGGVRFTGSMQMPLRCGPGAACARHFDLNAPVVDVGALTAALRGTNGSAMMRDLINRVEPMGPWPAFAGTLRAGRLNVGALVMQNASAEMAIEDGLTQVTSLDGRMLGGEAHGQGGMLRGGGYAAKFSLTRVSVDALAGLFGEDWGGGTLNLSGALKLRGGDAGALAHSAAGTVRWDWSGGAWDSAAGTPFAQFGHWTAEGAVSDGVITLAHGLVTNGSTAAAVTGTVSVGRRVDLEVQDEGGGAAREIRGTLSTPVAGRKRPE